MKCAGVARLRRLPCEFIIAIRNVYLFNFLSIQSSSRATFPSLQHSIPSTNAFDKPTIRWVGFVDMSTLLLHGMPTSTTLFNTSANCEQAHHTTWPINVDSTNRAILHSGRVTPIRTSTACLPACLLTSLACHLACRIAHR